jgi:hypothetical protein
MTSGEYRGVALVALRKVALFCILSWSARGFFVHSVPIFPRELQSVRAFTKMSKVLVADVPLCWIQV